MLARSSANAPAADAWEIERAPAFSYSNSLHQTICIWQPRAAVAAPVQFLSNRHWSVDLQVLVRDNNVDQALRVLKKKMQREGIFREMRLRRFCEKPSARTTRERTEAIRRARKLARKQAIREGLVVDTRKKRPEPTKINRAASQVGASARAPSREDNP